MTWIKICGITNLEDAMAAVEAGADAVGFVFYQNSPRYVDPDFARMIVAQLPLTVEKVGVFVDHLEPAREVAEYVGLTAVQLHTDKPDHLRMADGAPASCELYVALPAAVFLASGWQWFLPEENKRTIRAIFLDSGTPEQPGGTGRVFDWKQAAGLIATLSSQVRVVVAGGLTASNVAQAIGTLNPWGVDVSTGVEQTPGKKDPEKIRAFVSAARRAL